MVMVTALSPPPDIVEHRVDKERDVRFSNQLYSPVLDIVEHRVDKERKVRFSNSVIFSSPSYSRTQC